PADRRHGDVRRARLPGDAPRRDAHRPRRGAGPGGAPRALLLLRARGRGAGRRRRGRRGGRARQLAPPRAQGERRGGALRHAARAWAEGRSLALRLAAPARTGDRAARIAVAGPFADTTIEGRTARATVRPAYALALCDGHFPGDPLVPGSSLAALMAELGARLLAAEAPALAEIVRCVFPVPVRPHLPLLALP